MSTQNAKSPARPDNQNFGTPLEMRFDEFSKSGVQDDLKILNEKPTQSRKSKGLDSKAYVEEMSRMLKDADVKLMSSAKQIEYYRKSVETLQQQNNEFRNEKQQVVRQLNSLFSLYNKQKKTIEQLKQSKNEIDNERQSYKDRILTLERENERLKLDRSRELEIITTRHKNSLEEMERRIADLEKKLSISEEEKHALKMSETDLKEQIRTKDKKLIETEYSLDTTKSKLEHEIALLTKQKEQMVLDNRTLEKKLANAEREEERRADEERRIRKELARLTYQNEEISEQAQRWKEKYNTATIQEQSALKKMKNVPEASETPKMQRLAEIERKLETILSYHKSSSKTQKNAQRVKEAQKEENENEPQSLVGTEGEEQKASVEQQNEEVPEENEENEDEGNPEDMLKNLTVQILEKDELRNVNIIKMFKLDRIQLEDKANEYKNLLKAMGALYFANKYAKMVTPLFQHWIEQHQLKNNEAQIDAEEQEEAEPQEVENQEENEIQNVQVENEENPDMQHIRGDTESDPGPMNNMLDEGLEQKVDENSANNAENVESVENEGSNEGELEMADPSKKPKKHGIQIDPELANREALGEELTEEMRNKNGSEEEAEIYGKHTGGEIRVEEQPADWDDQNPEGEQEEIDAEEQMEFAQNNNGSHEGEESDELNRNERMELVEDFGRGKSKGKAKSDQDPAEYFDDRLEEDEDNMN